MKKVIYLLCAVLILAACKEKLDKNATLIKLKKERADLDVKIKEMEAGETKVAKTAPISVTEINPVDFHAFVEVQSQITSDENILATPKAPGMVKALMVKTGQGVTKGQVLALLDASAIEQQIETLSPQLTLLKTIYEKQQILWSQNIGTEVQLMTAKSNYEATMKQVSALETQRDMYRIVSPINGKVDALNLKVGDFAAPGVAGIRVVGMDKLKAEANLGQNYLGKVKQGDPVTLIFPDINDTIRTTITYVAEAVDIVSRSFIAQVMLGNNKKLHPNMSCIMKISNYHNPKALIVPVSVIQKTTNGSMLYIVDGDVAKSVFVTTGQNSNGKVEILSGLNTGDKVITAGYEEMDNGQKITVQ